MVDFIFKRKVSQRFTQSLAEEYGIIQRICLLIQQSSDTTSEFVISNS